MKKYKRTYLKIVCWLGLIAAGVASLCYILLAFILKSVAMVFLSMPFILSGLTGLWTLELLKETESKK